MASAAASSAAHGAVHQRHAREVGEGVDGLPRGLVAHAHGARGLGDGAALPDLAQDVDALVGHAMAQRFGEGDGLLLHGPNHAVGQANLLVILVRYSSTA
jgi:hypothetical protein